MTYRRSDGSVWVWLLFLGLAFVAAAIALGVFEFGSTAVELFIHKLINLGVL